MIPLGYASAAFILTGPVGTEPFVTTIGVKVTPAPGSAGFLSVANELFDVYDDTWLAETSNQLTLDRVDVTFAAPPSTASVSSSKASKPGRRSTASAPIAVALLVNKRTDLAGRMGKGRMFIPGVISDSAPGLDGVLDTGDLDSYQTTAQNFLGLLEGGTDSSLAGAVLFHGSGGPVTPSPVNYLSVSNKVGVIRRRLR